MLHPTLFEQDVRLVGRGWSPRVQDLCGLDDLPTGPGDWPRVHRYLEATFDRPAREDREAASAPMTAAASASGGPS